MNRFKWWSMLLFSSACVCFAYAYKYLQSDNFLDKDEIIKLCFIGTSVVFALCGLVTSMCNEGKLKMCSETILIFINLVIWIIFSIATLVETSNLGLDNDVIGDAG